MLQVGLSCIEEDATPVEDKEAMIDMDNPVCLPDAQEKDYKQIHVRDFLRRYQEMTLKEPSGFKAEFMTLQEVNETKCEVASLDQNRTKNRFQHILPCDEYRVELSTNQNDSDYINASFIKGILNGKDEDRMFIATQEPLEHTIADFWQMVWENDSTLIVTLTCPIKKNKSECSRFWPTMGQTKEIEDMCLRNVDENVEPFFVKREIEMSMGDSSRLITQYQLTLWDDDDTTETAMPIWKLLDEIEGITEQAGVSGPIVISCSSNADMTGIFIALAHLRSTMLHRHVIDVYNVVCDMRNRRVGMVQTEEQYQFIYESLVIRKVLRKTAFTIPIFKSNMKDWWRDEDDNPQRFRAWKEFKVLGFICPTKRHSVPQAGSLKRNLSKNRFDDIIPEDAYRPLLKTIPPYDTEANDYINASYHHSFQKKNAFIATQTPINRTMGAFWTMILEYNVVFIVMFEDNEGCSSDDEDLDHYWPDERHQQDYGPFCVGHRSSKELQSNITLRKMFITTQEDGKRSIQQFVINGHREQAAIAQDILTVVKCIQVRQRETDGPILVHCRNGIGLSGCFMAVYSVIDRLNDQHTIDVFATVRRLRQTRPKVVDTLEQYILIYEALHDYLIQTEAEPTHPIFMVL